MLVKEQSTDEIHLLKNDMRYTLTYQNVTIQTKGEWLISQIVNTNLTNLALVLTVIALSINMQSTSKQQSETIGQLQAAQNQVGNLLSDLKLQLTRLDNYETQLNYLHNLNLTELNEVAGSMTKLFIENSFNLNQQEFTLNMTSQWIKSVENNITQLFFNNDNIIRNKFIKKSQRLSFNNAVVIGQYTYYHDGINFCLTNKMRAMTHCFVEYRNNVDMGVVQYIHLNETNVGQRGVNQGQGGWFNVHTFAFMNLDVGCYNIKPSLLLTDVVIDISQFCETISF